uniref:Uncharacterized protein n=1 Tax=Anguilla anguilla TaxID=7936 RepID=A0A0E9TA40_ANGAN
MNPPSLPSIPMGRGPFFKAFQFWQSVRLHRALGAVLQQKE